jgi:glutaredoxin-like protein
MFNTQSNQSGVQAMLKNREGQKVPNVVFKTRQNDEFVDISTDELFKGKTVVVFSLPGAFTPTCSSTHLPRFNELAHVFKDNGVDDIICLSVNDAFVMNAWKQDQEAENITLIPDGNGEFTDGMGMLVDKSDLGFGKRSWRYSMLVRDGIVEKMFIEPEVPGDPFEVSDADTMLNYINPNAVKPEAVSIITKPGCPYCAKAKAMLQEHGMTYDEISLGHDATLRSVRAISGRDTVPQVYIGGRHIGDSEELAQYLAKQEKNAA